MLNGKELYEKYKGMEGVCEGVIGIVCGHDENDMIMLCQDVVKEEDGSIEDVAWDCLTIKDKIYKPEHQNGWYLYVDESEITINNGN